MRFLLPQFIATIYFDMPFAVWVLLRDQIPVCLYLLLRLNKQWNKCDISSGKT